ncbi:MAG: short-subunit dehydrogenase, partial [bacterium]
FNNKVVWITCASSGIAKELASHCHNNKQFLF